MLITLVQKQLLIFGTYILPEMSFETWLVDVNIRWYFSLVYLYTYMWRHVGYLTYIIESIA